MNAEYIIIKFESGGDTDKIRLVTEFTDLGKSEEFVDVLKASLNNEAVKKLPFSFDSAPSFLLPFTSSLFTPAFFCWSFLAQLGNQNPEKRSNPF